MEDHAGPIVKGKRTKRQRPQSPVPFEVAASSPNTATSSAELFSSTTEEEEDMANCLILLAQGQEYRKPGKLPAEMDDHNRCRSGNNYDEAVAAAASPKFTSRRYLEMATSTGNRAGYYVYQCKTCNRTFPSFQALGGHRASHKKPKNNTTAAATSHLGNNSYIDTLPLRSPSSVEKKQIFTLLPSDDEEGRFRKFTSLSLQLGRHSIFSHGNNNPKNGNGGGSKVHECSICGAEFTSGQALGGHMRRHRAVPVGVSDPNPVGAITTLSLTPLATFEDSQEPPPPTPAPDKAKANNLSLDLDLNLPASAQDHQADHHHRDDDRESCRPIEFTSLMEPSPSSQQQIEQKNQLAANNKSSLVFSASPALVDCHY